jgi:hypothetical protein
MTPYDKSIRKRYFGMRWIAQQEKIEFGFSNPDEAAHYYLRDGSPRACTYCGRIPEQDKVWGLDRINPSFGYVPGNLVPACSSHYEAQQLSCSGSKGRFTLLAWMERSMSRAHGGVVPFALVKKRLNSVYALAAALAAEKETHNAFI